MKLKQKKHFKNFKKKKVFLDIFFSLTLTCDDNFVKIKNRIRSRIQVINPDWANQIVSGSARICNT